MAAAEFLRMYLKREKTPEAYVLLGEVWYMLGDKERCELRRSARARPSSPPVTDTSSRSHFQRVSGVWHVGSF